MLLALFILTLLVIITYVAYLLLIPGSLKDFTVLLMLYSLVKLVWNGEELWYCLHIGFSTLEFPGKKIWSLLYKKQCDYDAWSAEVQSNSFVSQIKKIFQYLVGQTMQELSIAYSSYIRRINKLLSLLLFRVTREAFIGCRPLLWTVK